MNDGTDRRAYPRVSIDAEIRVRAAGTDDKGSPCRLRDASQGGVSVVTDAAPHAESIWVEILTASGQPVGEPLKAQVIRVDEQPEGGFCIACAFDAP